MKDYIIKKGENKYSPSAGTKLISDMINKLNFEDNINNTLGLPKSNRGYKPFTYIKSIILGLISEADCIMDIDKIKEDEVLKNIWNLNIPHSSRIGNFLYKFGLTKNIDALHNIMQSIAVKTIRKSNIDKVTLDADATFIASASSKEYRNYCYKKYKALSMLLGFVAQNRLLHISGNWKGQQKSRPEFRRPVIFRFWLKKYPHHIRTNKFCCLMKWWFLVMKIAFYKSNFINF